MPAAASPQGGLTAYMRSVDVVSSTGRHLQLWLQAESYSLDIMIGRGGLSHGREIHDWTFSPTGHRIFHFDRQRGTGSIDARPVITSDFGKVHLNLHRSGGWTSERCTSGSAHNAPFTARGTIAFRTRSGGRQPWGSIGSFAQPLAVSAHGSLRAFDNCVPPPPKTSCSDSYTWQHENLVTQPVEWTKGNVVPVLEGSRWHQSLGRRPHVQRLDDVMVRASPPLWHVHQDGSAVLHIRTRPDSRAQGRARLVARHPPTSRRIDCTDVREWTANFWRNGTHPLTIRMDLGRDIHAPNGTGGYFRRARAR
jgi:hypothetical protein